MKTTLKLAFFALAVSIAPAVLAAETDCYEVSELVTKQVTARPDMVLEVVGREVASHPGCSCEVVKAAIVASEAERSLVGQIVAVAIEAAPDRMRIIANCAIAVAPDALAEVQAVLARLEPQSGEGGSAKGGYEKGGYEKGGYAKSPKEPIVEPGPRNPLDGPYLIPGELPILPPSITPPSVSDPGDLGNVDLDIEEEGPGSGNGLEYPDLSFNR